MSHGFKIEDKYYYVMTNGHEYTPQNALLKSLEDHQGIHRMCIKFIDRKRDEARNEQTTWRNWSG